MFRKGSIKEQGDEMTFVAEHIALKLWVRIGSVFNILSLQFMY